MSKFYSALQRAYRTIITEQDQPPIDPNAAVTAPPQGVAPDQAAPTPIPEIPEQPNAEQQPLTSIGKTMLVRLIAQALMIDGIKTEEEQKIDSIGDINAENANEALKILIPIVTHYSQDEEIMDIKL